MVFNLLKFENKNLAREFLRKNYQVIYKRSSIYIIDKVIYIGILSQNLINSEHLLKSSNNVEQILNQWCHSELCDHLKFAEFEELSEVIKNASRIDCEGQNIIRSFQPLTNLMLIINITPDSFSDGGKYNTNEIIVKSVIEALNNGVSIIDVGAESTRPNASYVSVSDEIMRLELVVNKLIELKKYYDFQISLDTYKPEVVEYFLDKIDIVNDVSNKMPLNLVQNITMRGKKYILMHSLTVPADPNTTINNELDVTLEVLEWFKSRLSQYREYGINLENIILDIGIGFNKTSTQSWSLLRNIESFYELDCRVLVGHSRKSFLNHMTTNGYGNRDLETAIISNYLANKYVDYLRIHSYQEYLLVNNINNNLGVM